MNVLSIILLILKLLEQFKSSKNANQFANNVQASGRLPQANGALLKWLWDNREAILEFIKTLFPATPTDDPKPFGDDPRIVEIRELANKLSNTSNIPAGLEDLPPDLREDIDENDTE